jgi:hypothetical protein
MFDLAVVMDALRWAWSPPADAQGPTTEDDPPTSATSKSSSGRPTADARAYRCGRTTSCRPPRLNQKVGNEAHPTTAGPEAAHTSCGHHRRSHARHTGRFRNRDRGYVQLSTGFVGPAARRRSHICISVCLHRTGEAESDAIMDPTPTDRPGPGFGVHCRRHPTAARQRHALIRHMGNRPPGRTRRSCLRRGTPKKATHLGDSACHPCAASNRARHIRGRHVASQRVPRRR